MLQFITHTTERYDFLTGALRVLEGGCRWIQLRMKEAAENEVIDTAVQLKEACRRCGARLIIDDYVEIARMVGADGVHLGKNDMAPDAARKILGPEYIIGGTANTMDDMVRLAGLGVDYIGLGPFRFTSTKKNLSPILGLGGYRNIMEQCRSAGIDIPVVAIGGIEIDDIRDIMATGVSGVALSGMLLRAEDTARQTEKVLEILKSDI